MSDRDTGGPAFPANRDIRFQSEWDHEPGMTLRDYFAAKALLCGWSANKPPAYDDDTRAKYAYEMADAMIQARKK